MMGHNKGLHMVTWILVIVGGLNWLLVGLFSWDIGQIFGGMNSMISRIIYILVGVAAIYELVYHKKTCKVCETMSSPSQPRPSAM
ncbi:MAG: hypothetical protein UV57_C0026G0007 [Parcubacteria group bacterium GW2011_GWD2_43_10]|uniref:DUF378 domain-containing protein n=4 Tax=Patescibacteria group TaxID=1783273 RepID=A0A0G1UB96_9BACT|nr:MAG: hypothetical protein UV57_C0026G0007 [Parcubacteria group bacterium GW2011_GWD2_43_10]KKS92170.1 MAG: hypothetical protein UV69_C0036G0002 [Parcubacteria group bacterium GW2011_GWE2_43_12]KKT21153.1 MAG: hypothetical protein UW06_C0043G0004 [Parcubacteria group bacterium GW2011_GWE1_43_8]KKU91382.1 MAG: hypothetical protein UY22_C0043G0003 [Candidatus Amesbacteria bacterium GW2011_GWC1_48_10]